MEEAMEFVSHDLIQLFEGIYEKRSGFEVNEYRHDVKHGKGSIHIKKF